MLDNITLPSEKKKKEDNTSLFKTLRNTKILQK